MIEGLAPAEPDIEPLELSGGTLRLLVREPVQLKYLQQRCQEQFTEAVQAVMRLLVAVRFVGETEPAPRRALTIGIIHCTTDLLHQVDDFL